MPLFINSLNNIDLKQRNNLNPFFELEETGVMAPKKPNKNCLNYDINSSFNNLDKFFAKLFLYIKPDIMKK